MDNSAPLLPVTANILGDAVDKEAGRGPDCILVAALVLSACFSCALLGSLAFDCSVASLATFIVVCVLACCSMLRLSCCCAKELHMTPGRAKVLAACYASVAFVTICKGSFAVYQTQEGGAWADRSKEEIEAEFFGAPTFSGDLLVCAMVVELMAVVFMCLLVFKR